MTTTRIRTAAVAGLALSGIVLAGCQSEPGGGGDADEVTVSIRLWDEQAAAGYAQALPAFEKEHPGIKLDIEVIPWADYWTTLRNDVASGSVSDIFWTNSSNYVDYVDAGALVDIDEVLGTDSFADWSKTVVDQFTVEGKLYGVPQLTDPGIGVVYNTSLLEAAGVGVDEVENLVWDPSGAKDTLREVATRLTKDAAGNTPADAGFDPLTVKQFGYNAAYDFQAIWANYLASNGAVFQHADSDEIDFATPEGSEATQYVVDLINKDHVAPSAADTNDNGDFSRDQFLQGNLALFQTGAYNLANIVEGADFEWGIAPLPTGPAGRISLTNGIVAAGSAASAHPEQQKTVLEWLGSVDGAGALGAQGAALPAVLGAQQTYFDYWETQGVDVSPLLDVLENGTIPAPHGAKISEAFSAVKPILDEVFLGRTPVDDGLAAAQKAANDVIGE